MDIEVSTVQVAQGFLSTMLNGFAYEPCVLSWVQFSPGD